MNVELKLKKKNSERNGVGMRSRNGEIKQNWITSIDILDIALYQNNLLVWMVCSEQLHVIGVKTRVNT